MTHGDQESDTMIYSTSKGFVLTSHWKRALVAARWRVKRIAVAGYIGLSLS